MSDCRSLLITWPKGIDSVELMLSNLFQVMTGVGKLSPLVIDHSATTFLNFLNRNSVTPDPLGNRIKFRIAGTIPYFNSTDFQSLTKDIIKKSKFQTMADKYLIHLLDETDVIKKQLRVTDVLVLIDSIEVAKSFIFNLLTAHNERLNLYLCFVGARTIEDAAQSFDHIKREISKVYSAPFSLVFSGFTYSDPEKMALAESAGVSMVELYPQCALHGQIKYTLDLVLNSVNPRPVELTLGSLIK